MSDELYKMRVTDDPEPHLAYAGKTIPVAEIFGPTIQGEGALAGLPTYFLRVGGCDFACLWCDSDHAVLPEQVRSLERLTVEAASTRIRAHAVKYPGPDWLTISGGNPGLYDLTELVKDWHSVRSSSGNFPKVAVETQGSKWQDWFADVDLLTVSPKPPSSGMTQKYGADNGYLGLPILQAFVERYGNAWESRLTQRRPHAELRRMEDDPDSGFNLVFKVVVFDDADYEFARALHIRYPLIKFYLSCGTAMGGLSGKWAPPLLPVLDENVAQTVIDSPASLLHRYRWLVEKMMNDDAMSNVAAFPQLHALTWGITTRGV